MAERMYPSSKAANHGAPQALNGGAAAANASGPAFPATKAQLYGATRPPYRPQPPKPRRRRSLRGRCCCCCLWLTLILLALILLAAIAGGVFYVVYRPHRPSFSVSSLRLSSLNLTAANNALTSRLDISVTARNPNRKLVFLYDPVTISASTGGVAIGTGSFPAFVHGAKNTTSLRASVTGAGLSLDPAAASDLRKSSTLPLQIQLETKAGVKVGGLKTKKIGVRVYCDGINVSVPKQGKSSPPASSPDAACKVKLRIKIWKWNI